MSRHPIQSFLSLSCVIAASFLLFQGCESAEVDGASAAASSNGGSGGGGSGGGGTTTQSIDVNPSSATHTTTANLTVLEVAGVDGYTFSWSLSNSNIGSLSPTKGNKVTYKTISIPSEGATQTITVRGTSSSSSVIYQGTAVITHRAN